MSYDDEWFAQSIFNRASSPPPFRDTPLRDTPQSLVALPQASSHFQDSIDQSGHGESSAPLSAMQNHGDLEESSSSPYQTNRTSSAHPLEDHYEQTPHHIVEFGLSEDKILELAKAPGLSLESLRILQLSNRQCGVSQEEINEIKKYIKLPEKTCVMLNRVLKNSKSQLCLHSRRFDGSGNEIHIYNNRKKKHNDALLFSI